MPALLDRLPPGSRVAIVRLRSLGDCVLTTPALDLLHTARPDLEIIVLVEKRFSDVFAGNPAVARIVTGEGKLAARRERPRLCLNLHGGTRSVWMTVLSGARWRAGFGHHFHAWTYNARIPRAQEILGLQRTVHTAEHLASAMFWLGVPPREIPRARLYADATETGRYAVVHPMASAPEKMWPAAHFIAAAEWLAGQGLRPVFIGGPGEDLSAFAAFDTRPGRSLAETKALLAGATIFLGNDSGPAHMAAAFGLPVTVLYGASDPVVWAPWRTRHEIFHAPQGLATIEPARVIAALERLLA